MDKEYNNLIYFLQSMSSPLGTPLLSNLFTLQVTKYPNKPLITSPTLKPGESLQIIEPHGEVGIMRLAIFSVDNPNARFSISYSPTPNYMIDSDESPSELLFFGFDKVTNKIPYMAKAEQSINPYTGETVWVYTISYVPKEGSLFYNGWVSLKMYNPSDNPDNVVIWNIVTERWILKQKYINILTELTGGNK